MSKMEKEKFPMHKIFAEKAAGTNFADMVDLLELLRRSGYVIAKAQDVRRDVYLHYGGDIHEYVDLKNFILPDHKPPNQIVLGLWGIDYEEFMNEKAEMVVELAASGDTQSAGGE